MAPPRIQIDPELLARARVLYENGTSPDVIGRLIGVSAQTVRNRALEYGWSRARPARPPAPDAEWPDMPPPMCEPTDEDAMPDAIIANLARLIAREMMRARTYDHSPEAAARTLAMLTRSAANLAVLSERFRPLRQTAEKEPEIDEFGALSDPMRKLYAEVGDEEFLRRMVDFHRAYKEDAEARAEMRKQQLASSS